MGRREAREVVDFGGWDEGEGRAAGSNNIESAVPVFPVHIRSYQIRNQKWFHSSVDVSVDQKSGTRERAFVSLREAHSLLRSPEPHANSRRQGASALDHVPRKPVPRREVARVRFGPETSAASAAPTIKRPPTPPIRNSKCVLLILGGCLYPCHLHLLG